MSYLVRLFLLALIPSALLATPASADTVTVGAPLTGSFNPVVYCIPLCVSANTKLSDPGAQVSVPTTGTITRWRTIAGSGGAFRLRVLRPAGGGQYTLAGTSASQTPTGPGIDTFATSLPVQSGDLVGLENLSTAAKIGTAFPVGSEYHVWFGSFAEGANTSTATINNAYAGQVIGFNADVEFTSAPTGPPAPASQCVVPNLRGKTLKAAKKKIKAAGCKVGKATKGKGVKAATGKVTKQWPKAGKTRAAGTKVRVKLG